MKIKILVVEDEQSISGFIKAVLTANGYDVLLARTGAEANAMVISHCPTLVILDLGLPDMDGVELIRSIRQWSKLPIVVVSARMQEQDKVVALDLGADDFITKPFGTGELLAREKLSSPRDVFLLTLDGQGAVFCVRKEPET